MDATTRSTVNSDFAALPSPTASPLVYITGPPSANKKAVAETLALLFGDTKAVLIDHPYRVALTPPPPCTTPPPRPTPTTPAQKLSTNNPTPMRPLVTKTRSSYSRVVRPTGLRLPTGSARQRSASTPVLPSSPFADPFLTTLHQNPTRVAILTDSDQRVKAADAAPATGRLLLTVCLQTADQPAMPSVPEARSYTPTLNLTDTEPHTVGLRIVEFVYEETGKSRYSESGHWLGSAQCGVITPTLSPAEETDGIRF